MFKNSYFRVAVFSVLVTAALASAGAIKSWSAGDTLSTTDVNANFTHIHNTMVGGHGGRLVNADVNALANIGYTKIQNGRGIARAWADVESTCSSTPCTVDESLNITSISRSGAGTYTVTLNYTATDNVFSVFVQSHTSTAICWGTSASTTTVSVACSDYDAAIGPTATDAAFSVIVLDGD